MVRDCLAENPEEATLLAMLSRVLTAQNKFIEGELAAKEAISNDPELSLGYSSLAWNLVFQTQFHKAQETAQDALRLHAEDDDTLYCLATAQLSLLEYHTALESIDKALEIDSEDARYMAFRGMVLFQQDRLEAAWECVDQALAIDPELAMAHTVRGWLNWKTGRYHKAKSDFLTALKLKPTDQKTKEGLREAILGIYPVYRVLFFYYKWLAERSPGQGLALIYVYAGLLSLMLMIGIISPTHATPTAWCAAGLIFMLFLGRSRRVIATLLLSFQPLGRQLVLLEEKVFSLIGVLYFSLCISFAVKAALKGDSYYLTIALAILLYVIPFGTVLKNLNKPAAWGYAVWVLTCGTLAFFPMENGIQRLFGYLFVLGCLFFRRTLTMFGVSIHK